MEGELPQVIHLTEIIRCPNIKAKMSEVVLDWGKRAHERFYGEYKRMFPKAKIEERFCINIMGISLMFSPDIIRDKYVIELKRSRRNLTIYLGMVQVMCYATLLRKMGYDIEKCYLITINRKGHAEKVYEIPYHKEYDNLILSWLVERLSGNRLPICEFECLTCEDRNCKNRHMYHKFPLDTYLHYVLFKANMLDYIEEG